MYFKTIFIAIISLVVFKLVNFPKIFVAGEMKNIMMKNDFKAYIDLDTVNKQNLYALGPVEDLKGETIIMDGNIYTSQFINGEIKNNLNKITKNAMLVYSYVDKWKPFSVEIKINNYAELEKAIYAIAKENNYDTTKPFPFKINAKVKGVKYHIIDWKKETLHTKENHKQFAYFGNEKNKEMQFLGFYSDHHHSVFTHHTTNMHIHILDTTTKNVGHLDELKINRKWTIYLPELNK